MENRPDLARFSLMADNSQFEKLLATPELPDLGPGPRAGVQTEKELEQPMAEIFRSSKISPQNQQLIRAVVLLWHDHLEAAHVISQEIETADGAFVHGIMHRREPDYGNAKYWFRRVGKHEAFVEIARRVRELLEARNERTLLSRLIPNGDWDAFAFVDLCQEAAKRKMPDSAILREVQRVETETLLQRFCS